MSAAFTIDELSARSGVASRTIRFYQSEGALPPPRRHGRISLYDEEHLHRLQLIAELQARGLTLGLIRDLLGRAEPGDLSVVEWLGLTDQLGAPWLEDRPEVFSEADLASRLSDRNLALLDAFIEAELVDRWADGNYFVSSPTLVDMANELDLAGIDPEISMAAVTIMRRNLRRGIDEVVRLLVRRAGQGFGRHLDPAELADALEAFRPVATRAVVLLFEQEVERSLRAAGWPSVEGSPVEREITKDRVRGDHPSPG